VAYRLTPEAARLRRRKRKLDVTFREAQRWLEKIGGSWLEAKEQVPHKGSVIVEVQSAMRGRVARHALFDDRLQGYERELAIHEAFVRACTELKYDLSR
jgi:hypothetical protein